MTSFEQGLLAGSWTLWSVSLLVVACRLASRRIALGSFRKLQLDDYLMLVAVGTFTGVVIASNEVAVDGSNYVPDGVVDTWTPEQVANAEWGSKMLLALEEFMLATIWLVKACFLILYARLTALLNERWLVRAIAVYCAVGYVVIQILYLGVWCRPIYDYWAVPVPPSHSECKTYHNHMITVTALHVSSDLAMLCVPLPLLARSRLPPARKAVLCAVFSLGLLVVVVAILNRYFNFTESNSLVFLSWYNGEASTAVIVANIPFCWPLLRRVFALGPWGDSTAGGVSSAAAGGGAGAAGGGHFFFDTNNNNMGNYRGSNRHGAISLGTIGGGGVDGTDRRAKRRRWTDEDAIMGVSIRSRSESADDRMRGGRDGSTFTAEGKESSSGGGSQRDEQEADSLDGMKKDGGGGGRRRQEQQREWESDLDRKRRDEEDGAGGGGTKRASDYELKIGV